MYKHSVQISNKDAQQMNFRVSAGRPLTPQGFREALAHIGIGFWTIVIDADVALSSFGKGMFR